MNDRELAVAIVNRLNLLCEDPAVRRLIGSLIEVRVPVEATVAHHATIQAQSQDGTWVVGMLGLLNGLVGVIPSGPKKDWGHIVAHFDDDTQALTHFSLTDPYGPAS